MLISHMFAEIWFVLCLGDTQAAAILIMNLKISKVSVSAEPFYTTFSEVVQVH